MFIKRLNNNDLQIGTWHLDRNGRFGRALGSNYTVHATSHWSGTWKQWFATGGKEGEEPPEEIKRQKELWDKYIVTQAGTPEFDRAGAAYYEYFARELPMIGTVGLTPRPLIVSNRLHNVQEKGTSWISDNNFYAPFWTAQFYIEE